MTQSHETSRQSRHGDYGHCTEHAQWTADDPVKCPPHIATGSEVGSPQEADTFDARTRTLRENYSSNLRLNWTIDTFHKAKEEVSRDRFITYDLCRDLDVDPININ